METKACGIVPGSCSASEDRLAVLPARVAQSWLIPPWEVLLQASAFRIWKLCIIPCLAFFLSATVRGLLAEQNGKLWDLVFYH